MEKRWQVQRERARHLVGKWVRRLGLGWWVHIEFRYHWKKGECRKVFGRPSTLGYQSAIDRGTDREANGVRTALMITTADWRYLEAVVQVNLRAMEGIGDERLEIYFIHEMMHAILAELEVTDKDHEERVASWLALAFLWTDQGKG